MVEIMCVINNTNTHLTKHHTIPTQYRKHFKLKYKDKNSCDIVVLGREVYDEYELQADKLKLKLYNDYITNYERELISNFFRAKKFIIQ